MAYLIPVTVAIAASQSWFQGGRVIASGDLAPPLAPAMDYVSHWSNFLTGEGGPSYSIIQLPYFETISLWKELGLTEAAFQRVWLSLLFAGAAGAVVFLALALTGSPFGAGVAGILACFNAYRLTTQADPIPLLATIMAGLLGGLVVLSASRNVNPAWFALVSLGMGYVFVNPAHAALVIIWVVICTVLVCGQHGRNGLSSAIRFLARAVPLAIILNLWWIVPAALTIFGSEFTARFAASGVEMWSWTHARSSLLNALTLNTTWAWSYPEYFPYATSLETFPFSALRFLAPLLAAAGVVVSVRRGRRLAIMLGVVVIGSVWVAKGLHPPFPMVNRWVYDTVPGFWLFRDPAKVLLLVSLAFALLGGIAVTQLARFAARATQRRAAGLAASSLVLAGAVGYPYPLLTGEVIPDQRPLLPSAHVKVPDFWRRAASVLNSRNPSGKVLVLPASDFYQLPTTWGYHGVSFTGMLLRQPVIELVPGGYFRPPGSVSSIVRSIERDILDGDSVGLSRKLGSLGVSHLVLRGDLDTSFPGRTFRDPSLLEAALGRLPIVAPEETFGPISLYRITEFDGLALARIPAEYVASDALVPDLLEGLPPQVALVTQPNAISTSFPSAQGGRAIDLPGGSTQVLRMESERLWRVDGRTEGRTVHLRLSDPLVVRVGSQRMPSLDPRILRIPAGSPPLVVTIGDATFYIPPETDTWTSLGVVRLRKGSSRLRIAARENAQVIGTADATTVSDCNRYDRRTPREVGIAATVIEGPNGSAVQLRARDHSACVAYPITPVEPGGLYRVELDYRGVRGSPPRACLWQDGPERCASLPPLDFSPGWHRLEATVRADRQTQGLRLYVYAEGTGEGETIAEYGEPRVRHYETVVVRDLTEPRTVSVDDVRLPPGQVNLTVDNPFPPVPPISVNRALPVSDCNRYDRRIPREVGIAATVVEGPNGSAVQLRARDHSACVAYPISRVEPGGLYRVALDHRGVRGRPPRACLWQDGPERCASLPPLNLSPGWNRLEATVRVDRQTQGLRLFVYADGAGGVETVAEYGEPRVTPSAQLQVAFVKTPGSSHLPSVTVDRRSPSEFVVDVRDSRVPFALMITEAFGPGWRLEYPGKTAQEAQHLRADGYANGWIVPWQGSYQLRIWYQPEVVAVVARRISLLAIPLLLLWSTRRRRRHGHPRSRTFREWASVRQPIGRSRTYSPHRC
jgi:arabinofuranan 3-O-arabinosyltransferase